MGDSDAYNRKEFEACVTGAVLTAELLRSEALGEKSHKPPTLTVSDAAWLNKNVLELTIDRNGDGKPDGKAKVNRTLTGGIDSIDLDLNNDGKYEGKISVDRSTLGWVNSMKIDLYNDRKIVAKLTPNKSFSGYTTSMDIDRKDDGSVDGKLTYQFNYTFSNYYSDIDVDRANKGKTDYSMHVTRGDWTKRLQSLSPKK